MSSHQERRGPVLIVPRPRPTDAELLAAETAAWVDRKFRLGLTALEMRVHDSLVKGSVSTPAELDVMLGGRCSWLTRREAPLSCDSCHEEEVDLVQIATGYDEEDAVHLCRGCMSEALAAFPEERPR